MGGSRIKRGVKVWPVATSLLKSELFGWLRLERPTDESGDPFPPGYCHFPKYHDEYFKQLTAEQLMSRTVRGYRRTEWQKTRERNEALDCRVYARPETQAGAIRLSVIIELSKIVRRLSERHSKHHFSAGASKGRDRTGYFSA